MLINILKKYGQLIIIILLITVLLLNLNLSDSSETTRKQTVVIPEVIGKIDKSQVIINHKKIKDSIVYKKGQTIYTENPVNKKMAEELVQAMKDQDTLKVLKLYLSSIGEREQTRIFSDKNQTIEVYTKVQGNILEQKIAKYTIKEKEVKVDVPIKETKFAVYTGASLNYTTELKIVPTVDLGIQISKRLIITGSYGLDKSTQVGILYKIKL